MSWTPRSHSPAGRRSSAHDWAGTAAVDSVTMRCTKGTLPPTETGSLPLEALGAHLGITVNF
jgi:hypothetical protein